jgi:MoaA/NifB/PqqE/SkfB family radical SAM enzyme
MSEMAGWAVMFVDMVGSTEFKYQHADKPDEVNQTFMDLYTLILDNSEGKEHSKFTGDGAMVIFRPDRRRCEHALDSAEKILQAIDRRNLRFAHPPIHIRVGIATGECYELVLRQELSGTVVDLAARLCQETESDTILVDRTTKENSGVPAHRFEECKGRLPLKGVPLPSGNRDQYFYYKPHRFLRAAADENFSEGLLALYPDRAALNRDLPPARWIRLAAPKSTVLVAGRTLVSWKNYCTEMRMAAKKKDLRFHFLLSSPASGKYLEGQQRSDIERDWAEMQPVFMELSNEDPTHFQFVVTDHLFLDSIFCCRVVIPGEDQGNHIGRDLHKLIALQDINAAPGKDKASFLFACKCNRNDEEGEIRCKAHGLYRRTRLVFKMERQLQASQSPSPLGVTVNESPSLRALDRILQHCGEGLNVRNNHPSAYIHRVIPHLQAIHDDNLSRVPPPLCIQLQISSSCSTDCVMCDHHLSSQRKDELSEEDWKKVLVSIAEHGVRTIVLSGGEPLMREDLANLVEFAAENRFAVGMLTNGTMVMQDEERRERAIAAIRRTATWVAISVDGTPSEDQAIRHPAVAGRMAVVKDFVEKLKGGPSVSATVTLQKDNINMNLKEAWTFIYKELGIPLVNFKLATGAKQAMAKTPAYLLLGEELSRLDEFLWNYPVDQQEEPKNNLAYLRRCFASGVFTRTDVIDGSPVRSFYGGERGAFRCFTPFLFSLVDSDGTVYPCCHLYRDNHGDDPRSSYFRGTHALGQLREFGFDFGRIWNGGKYAEERRRLERIDPNHPDFLPCGECTRHCQHNRVLTEIYSAYANNLSELQRPTTAGNAAQKPVWF